MCGRSSALNRHTRSWALKHYSLTLWFPKISPQCQFFLEIRRGAPDVVLIWFWLECYFCFVQCNQHICSRVAAQTIMTFTKSSLPTLTYQSRSTDYQSLDSGHCEYLSQTLLLHCWCFPVSIVINPSLACHMSHWQYTWVFLSFPFLSCYFLCQSISLLPPLKPAEGKPQEKMLHTHCFNGSEVTVIRTKKYK